MKQKRPTSNGWTKERRAKAAARAKANKPWQHSTGPRTATGKAACARNAFKHGKNSTPYLVELSRLHQLLDYMAIKTRILDISAQKCINDSLEMHNRINKWRH